MPNSTAAVNAISTLIAGTIPASMAAAGSAGSAGGGSSPNDSNTIIARPMTAR